MRAAGPIARIWPEIAAIAPTTRNRAALKCNDSLQNRHVALPPGSSDRDPERLLQREREDDRQDEEDDHPVRLPSEQAHGPGFIRHIDGDYGDGAGDRWLDRIQHLVQ